MNPDISLAEFSILARQTGLPIADADIPSLHEGYVKLKAMANAFTRPADPCTELALTFTPESLR